MTSGFTLAQDVARNTKIEYYGTSIGYSDISKKILREKYESEAEEYARIARQEKFYLSVKMGLMSKAVGSYTLASRFSKNGEYNGDIKELKEEMQKDKINTLK